nr:MAG TPA: hypothetical protein [Caudoviricetes sp.]
MVYHSNYWIYDIQSTTVLNKRISQYRHCLYWVYFIFIVKVNICSYIL